MNPECNSPESADSQTTEVKIQVDKETNERVIRFAEKHNLSPTETIRKAIYLFMEQQKEEEENE